MNHLFPGCERNNCIRSFMLHCMLHKNTKEKTIWDGFRYKINTCYSARDKIVYNHPLDNVQVIAFTAEEVIMDADCDGIRSTLVAPNSRTNWNINFGYLLISELGLCLQPEGPKSTLAYQSICNLLCAFWAQIKDLVSMVTWPRDMETGSVTWECD